MGILDRFYLLLGNGDIMRGAKVFDICLAGVFVIIVIIAAVCIIMGVRNDRKVRDVSLTSGKAKKARERQLRSVFNESLDNGTVIPAPADEVDDSDGDERPARSRKVHVNRRAVIDDVRRGHGDLPESDEDKAPKVALKRSTQRPNDDITRTGDDDGAGTGPERPDLAGDGMDTGGIPERADPMASRPPDTDTGREQADDGPRHARHAKPAAGRNPFSRPIGINDIKGRR